MKRFLLALALICTAVPARAVDFLVTAPNVAALRTVGAAMVDLWVPDSKTQTGADVPAHIGTQGQWNALGGWAWQYIGSWMVQIGTTTDQFGNTVPVYGPKDTNVYGILRWNDDYTKIKLPGGVTVVKGSTTVNGIVTPTLTVTVTALGVTFTSPLPVDVPVRFE